MTNKTFDRHSWRRLSKFLQDILQSGGLKLDHQCMYIKVWKFDLKCFEFKYILIIKKSGKQQNSQNLVTSLYFDSYQIITINNLGNAESIIRLLIDRSLIRWPVVRSKRYDDAYPEAVGSENVINTCVEQLL